MTDAVKAVDTSTADEPGQAAAAEEISVPRAITIEVNGPGEESVGAVPSVEPPGDAGKTSCDRRSRTQIKTARLDSRDFRPSWPIAIAALEQLSGWSVLALRLGTLALIQQCVRELAEEKAHADTVARLRALTDALAHMPLEI